MWKISENVKIKLRKLSWIFDCFKNRPKNKMKILLDELINKLIDITLYEVENNILEIKVEYQNTNLPKFIQQKFKMSVI